MTTAKKLLTADDLLALLCAGEHPRPSNLTK